MTDSDYAIIANNDFPAIYASLARLHQDDDEVLGKLANLESESILAIHNSKNFNSGMEKLQDLAELRDGWTWRSDSYLTTGKNALALIDRLSEFMDLGEISVSTNEFVFIIIGFEHKGVSYEIVSHRSETFGISRGKIGDVNYKHASPINRETAIKKFLKWTTPKK
jgi:hypothetical protein